MSDVKSVAARVGFAAAILFAAWYVLGQISAFANSVPFRLVPSISDLTQAMTWATQLLGLVSTLSGLLGVTTVSQDAKTLGQVGGTLVANGGLLLAGAALLAIGAWALPAPIR